MQRIIKVDVIIPTYRPDQKFHHLLEMLQKQTYPIHEIIIVNTGESYFPKEEYEKNSNMKVFHISKKEFDHGRTRAFAAKKASGDFLLYMTQDAVPEDIFLIENLLRAFEDETVGASYARQLPTEDCKFIERYTRMFNYGEESMVKSLEDLETLGIKTYFCSNVCAMYRKKYYRELGGFVKKTIFNEDMLFAGKLINAGYKVAYVATAKVLHSHNYSGIQQLKRNFDLGVSQARYPDLFESVPSESEGKKLVKATAVYLLKQHKPWLLLDLVIKSGFKLIGFKLGKSYKVLPKRLILKLTMNRAYWYDI
jgi:Glycosyltransferases, probably involved in cell wall biogenesis